MISVT